MKLRKPCPEHLRYERHGFDPDEEGYGSICPGGVFLPDDTLIIERLEDREFYRAVNQFMANWYNPKPEWGPDHPSYDEMGQ